MRFKDPELFERKMKWVFYWSKKKREKEKGTYVKLHGHGRTHDLSIHEEIVRLKVSLTFLNEKQKV